MIVLALHAACAVVSIWIEAVVYNMQQSHFCNVSFVCVCVCVYIYIYVCVCVCMYLYINYVA